MRLFKCTDNANEFVSTLTCRFPPFQASETGILSVISSLNDVFDATDHKHKTYISSMNEWVGGLYTELSQGLKVIG